MIVLTLPILSANKYWRPARIGGRATIVPSKEAKEYRKTVAERCRRAGITAPIKGRIEVALQLYPYRPLDWQKRMRDMGAAWDDSVQCIDLTNAEKVLLDALNGVAFEDDKRVWRYTAQRMEPDDQGARVVLYVRAMPVAKVQEVLL